MSPSRKRLTRLTNHAAERKAFDKRLDRLESILDKSEIPAEWKEKLLGAFRARPSQQPMLKTIEEVPRFVHELNFGRVFDMEALRAAKKR